MSYLPRAGVKGMWVLTTKIMSSKQVPSLSIYVCVCGGYIHVNADALWRAEEGMRSPGAGVVCGCEPGSQIQVFCVCSKCS